METEAVIKEVQEKQKIQIEEKENMMDKEFQILEHDNNNNQRNPKVNGDSTPIYEINSVDEVDGQEDMNTITSDTITISNHNPMIVPRDIDSSQEVVEFSVSSIECQESKSITTTERIEEDVQKNKVVGNIITSEDDSMKTDDDVGSEHKKEGCPSDGKTDIQSASANKQAETMSVEKKNAVVNANGSSSALLDVEKSENHTDEKENKSRKSKEVKSEEECDVLLVAESVVGKNSQQTEIALDLTELASVQKSENTDKVSDDSEIQNVENEKEVYAPPSIENSEEKAHQIDQVSTSSIAEESSIAETLFGDANEDKVTKQTDSSIDIEKLENDGDVGSQKKRDYRVTISSITTEIFKEKIQDEEDKQLMGNAHNGDQDNNNSDPKMESETAYATSTKKCPDEIVESSTHNNELLDKVTQNEHIYTAKNDQTSILDVSAQEICDEKNGIDENSRNDVLTEEKDKIKEDDEDALRILTQKDMKDAEGPGTLTERKIEELNMEDSKSEANKVQAIINGKDAEGLKNPMSIIEISIEVISEATEDNRNELSEKCENFIEQKIVQSSVKTKLLEDRDLEMISEISAVEKKNGPSIDNDEKYQKHIGDAVFMEETMDIGLHSGEKNLLNEKDATNMENLKVQELESACDNSRMESEKVDQSKDSGNYDKIEENVESSRMLEKLKESNKPEVPSGTVVNEKMEQQVDLVQVQTAGKIEASTMEELIFKEENLNIVDSLERKEYEVSKDEEVQIKGTASIPNALESSAEGTFEEKEKPKDIISSAASTIEEQIIEKEVRVDEVKLIEKLDTASVINNSIENEKDSDHHPVLPQHHIEVLDSIDIETIEVINANFSTASSKETFEEKIKNNYGDVDVDLKENIKEDGSSEVLASQQIIRDGIQLAEEKIVPQKEESYNEIGQSDTSTDFNQHTVKDSLPVSQFLLDQIMGADSHSQAIDSMGEESRNLDVSETTSKDEIILKEDSEDLADKIEKKPDMEMVDGTGTKNIASAVNGSDGTKDPESPIDYKESIKVSLTEIKADVEELRNADTFTKFNATVAKEETTKIKILSGSETLDNNFDDSKEKIPSEDNKNVADLEELQTRHEIVEKVTVGDNTSKTIESAEVQDAERFNSSQIVEKVITYDDPFELIDSEEVQHMESSIIGTVEEKEKAEDASTFVASTIEEQIIEKVGMEEVALRENLDTTSAKNDGTSNEKSLDALYAIKKMQTNVYMNEDETNKNLHDMTITEETYQEITEAASMDNKIEIKETQVGESKKESLAAGDSVDKTESKRFKDKVEVVTTEPIEETIPMTEGIISFAELDEASDNNVKEEKINLEKAEANEVHDATCSTNQGITDKKDSEPHPVLPQNNSEKETAEAFSANFSAAITKEITEEEIQNNYGDELPKESADDDVDPNKNIKEDGSYSEVFASQTNIKDDTQSAEEKVAPEKQEADDEIGRSDTSTDFNQQTVEDNLPVSQFLLDRIMGADSLSHAEDSNEEALESKPCLSLEDKRQNDNEKGVEDPKTLNDSLKEVEMDESEVSKKIRQELVRGSDAETKEEFSPDRPVSIEKLCEIANVNEIPGENLKVLKTTLKEEMVSKEGRKDLADRIEEKPEIIVKEERMDSADNIEKRPDAEMADGTGTDSITSAVIESDGVEFRSADTVNKSNATVVEQTANTEILPSSKTLVKNLDVSKEEIPSEDCKNVADLKQLQTNTEMVGDNTSKTIESALVKDAENSVSCQIVEKAEDGALMAISSSEVKESESFITNEIVEKIVAEDKTLTEISSSIVKDAESIVTSEQAADTEILPGSKTIVKNLDVSIEEIPSEDCKNVADLKQLQTNTEMVGDNTSKTIESALVKDAENSVPCQIVEKAEDGTLMAISSSEVKESESLITSETVEKIAAADKTLTEISSSEVKDAESIVTSEQAADTEILPGSKTIVKNLDVSKEEIPSEDCKNVADLKQLQTNTEMVGDNTSKTIESALVKDAENSVSCQIVEKAEDGALMAISSSEVKESESFITNEIVEKIVAEDKTLTEISSSIVKDAESIVTSEQAADTEILPGSKTIVKNLDVSKEEIPSEDCKNVADLKQLQTNTEMVGDNTSKTIESALVKDAENSVSCQIVEKAEDGTLMAISSSEVKESESLITSETVEKIAAADKTLTEISSSEVKDAESIVTSEAAVEDNQFQVAKGLGYVVVRDKKQGEESIANSDEQVKMMTTEEHVDHVKETSIGDLEECGKQQEQKSVEVKNQNDEGCLEENLERKGAQDEVKNQSDVQVKHVIEKSGHETEGKHSPPNKKHGTILSGVRSKFKHSISSVKKAMTCSSSVPHLTQETR